MVLSVMVPPEKTWMITGETKLISSLPASIREPNTSILAGLLKLSGVEPELLIVTVIPAGIMATSVPVGTISFHVVGELHWPLAAATMSTACAVPDIMSRHMDRKRRDIPGRDSGVRADCIRGCLGARKGRLEMGVKVR